MKDLISKADVLETYAELYDTFEDNQFIRKELNKVYDKLNGLPYAQPEPPEDICGECDAWNKYKSEHKTGRWIPVSERLPDEYGEYLVTKHTIGWNCEEYVSNDIAYFDNDGFHKADMVIAWMPLPDPFREEGDE